MTSKIPTSVQPAHRQLGRPFPLVPRLAESDWPLGDRSRNCRRTRYEREFIARSSAILASRGTTRVNKDERRRHCDRNAPEQIAHIAPVEVAQTAWFALRHFLPACRSHIRRTSLQGPLDYPSAILGMDGEPRELAEKWGQKKAFPYFCPHFSANFRPNRELLIIHRQRHANQAVCATLLPYAHAHCVGRLAANRHDDIDFALARQRARERRVDLIQASQLQLVSSINHRQVHIAQPDAHRIE